MSPPIFGTLCARRIQYLLQWWLKLESVCQSPLPVARGLSAIRVLRLLARGLTLVIPPAPTTDSGQCSLTIRDGSSLPRTLLYDIALQICIANVEQLALAKAVRHAWSFELGHELELAELITKRDVAHVVQASVAIHREAEPATSLSCLTDYKEVRCVPVFSGDNVLDNLIRNGLAEVDALNPDSIDHT